MKIEITSHFIRDRRYERVGTAKEAIRLAQEAWDNPDELPDWAKKKQRRAEKRCPDTYDFRAKGGYVFLFGWRPSVKEWRQPILITVLHESDTEYIRSKRKLNWELHQMMVKR